MRIFFSVILCLFVGNRALANDTDLKPYLKSWAVADTSQTHLAEQTYKHLKKMSVGEFHRLIVQLKTHLTKHYDERIWVRSMMFEVFGKIELAIWKSENRPKDAALVFKGIKIANRLKDEQLKAELFALYAELFPRTSNYTLYNLKAIALQNKIGVAHFVFVANRYYNVAYGLYLNEDYRQSVNYALTGLSLENGDISSFNQKLYVLLNDVVASCYFRLDLIDSAKFHYQKIADTLRKKPLANQNEQQLWLAIARGGIGRAAFLQGNDRSAIPMIEDYLKTSALLKAEDNAASAANLLGDIYLKQKSYEMALQAYRRAFAYAIKTNALREKTWSAKGLAAVFRIIKPTDSAFAYFHLYHSYRDSLIENSNRGKLAAINASIAFDEMQSDLMEANSTINQQRLLRNFILVAVFLMAVIGLLFYHRKMLQQKLAADALSRKRELAETEAKQAKNQISSFKENIIEKENLIVNLQKQLVAGNEQAHQSLLQYTLVTDAAWEKFRLEFSKAYPNFLRSLQNRLPAISPAEERLATLLYLKLTDNQMANTLGISKESVGRSKRRLKQRLQLKQEVKLDVFIAGLA